MPGALLRIEIPVQREPGGRFHLASLGEAEFEMFERRFVNRRFPLPEAQAIGEPKLRRILLSGGPSKNYRIPMETGHLRDDLITWWCVGDREEIGDLLPHVSHLGKRRAVGLGRVREWRVDPCEAWPGFPVVRDGRALRPLPTDWPGLDQPALAYRTLTYPYWERAREELCAVP
jgi:CRISPR type IV-associated protein Csf3